MPLPWRPARPRGPASARSRGPNAPSRARSSHRGTAAPRLARSSRALRPSSPSDALQPVGGAQNELHHGRRRSLTVLVPDHGYVVSLRSLDDVVLQVADVREVVEVLVERAGPFGRDVANPEVARVSVLALDREHALDDERVADRRDHPGHEVHALEHRRPALGEGALDRGVDADEDVPRLVEEPVQQRVDLLGLGAPECAPGFEARVVDRRHELGAEERSERLADEVGRRDARDAEPVRDLGGDRRLPGSRRAADEDDDREVELGELGVAAEALDRLAPLPLADDVFADLLQAVEPDRVGVPVLHVLLHPPCHLVRAHRGDADAHERPGHQAFRERLVAAERQRVGAPALGHPATGCAVADSARASSSASRSMLASSGCTSFMAKTQSAPRSSAASATTSMAAALISIRNTSASTRCSSSRSAARSARFRETWTTSAPRWSTGAGPAVKTARRWPSTGATGLSRSSTGITGMFFSSRTASLSPPPTSRTRSEIKTRYGLR